jgi:hypothetical protein
MMARGLAAPGAVESAVPPAKVDDDTSTTAEPPPRRFHPDVVTGLAVVALCLVVWAVTTTFDEVPVALTQGMGPAAFPRLVLGVIILLALWLAWTASSRPRPEYETVHPMVYATAGSIVAVSGAMLVFGIHGAVLASCIGIGLLWGERRLLLLATIAIGMSLAIHFAFIRGFGIGLPRGLLQTWLG